MTRLSEQAIRLTEQVQPVLADRTVAWEGCPFCRAKGVQELKSHTRPNLPTKDLPDLQPTTHLEAKMDERNEKSLCLDNRP
jgi:hypothetical protein